jgi:hypothetical protein
MDDEAATARMEAATARLNELANGLPTRPSSFADIVLRAQVARCHADKDLQGRLVGLSDDDRVDSEQESAARLIAAVLDYAGIDHRRT